MSDKIISKILDCADNMTQVIGARNVSALEEMERSRQDDGYLKAGEFEKKFPGSTVMAAGGVIINRENPGKMDWADKPKRTALAINTALILGFCEHGGIEAGQARRILSAIEAGEIVNIAIQY